MSTIHCACPKIDPKEWDGKEFDWENKTFYFLPINNFLHKPIDLEEKVRLLKKSVTASNYEFVDVRVILTEWAAFKGRILTQIKNPEIYDANIHIFDMGKIYTSVYQGPQKGLKQAVADFQSQILLEKGIPAQNTFVWHAHCHICAKTKEHLSVIFIKT